MGSKKSKSKAPAPPKIEEAPPIMQEADAVATQEYMQAKQDDRMSVESTLMTSPIEPKETMMSTASKKKKKKITDTETLNTVASTMGTMGY
jgi:hypothetical protein